MSKQVFRGATGQSVDVFIQDSSQTNGVGLIGLLWNTANLKVTQRRGYLGTPAPITLAPLANAQTAWSSGGFVEIDPILMRGWYRLDLPVAVVAAASGVDCVGLYFYGATNMAPTPLDVQLTGYNPYGPPVTMQDIRDTNAMALTGTITPATTSIDKYLIDSKAKTDQMTYSIANRLDSNVLNMRGFALTAKSGSNFNVFFENAGADTTKVVNNVGALSITEANALADALLDRANAIEASLTMRETLRLVAAMAAGRTNGFVPGASGTGNVRDVSNTKNRMVFGYDANGNITTVTLNLT